METKFQSNFQRIDNAMEYLHGKIDEGKGRYGELVHDVFLNLKRFEEIMARKRREYPPAIDDNQSWLMATDIVACEQVQYLCEADKLNEAHTASELLTKIKEKAKDLENMTDDKFSALFNVFQQIKD